MIILKIYFFWAENKYVNDKMRETGEESSILCFKMSRRTQKQQQQ